MKALIIIDHGSKRSKANDLLTEIKALIKVKRPHLIVEIAHMELAPPTISDAIASCISKGATRLIIHPYMLGPGRHVSEDIPKLIKKVMINYPLVSTHITDPLGVDASLADLVLKRSFL
jgi:sirohydrochlorin ferrochelatase